MILRSVSKIHILLVISIPAPLSAAEAVFSVSMSGWPFPDKAKAEALPL